MSVRTAQTGSPPIQRALLVSLFVSAGSGIAYEILAATTLTDLLGSSVYYFSLVIGVYLAALGIGGWLSARVGTALFERLILVELVLAALGGSLALLITGSELVISNTFDAVAFFMRAQEWPALASIFGPVGSRIAFVSFSLALVLLTGILVGLELPLFSRLLATMEDLKGALGKALFWDYCGGLVMAVSLPILFLPNIGLLRTTFLMGLLNACAGLTLILALGRRVKSGLRATVALAAVVVLNVGGIVAAHQVEMFLEEEQYLNEEVRVFRRSPYQKIVLTQSPTGALKLYLNGQLQFVSGTPERIYHESLVHPAMAVADHRVEVLILGGGDGLALREVLKYPEVRTVTLVDIDRQVVDLAKGFESLTRLTEGSFFDPRVRLVIDDAFMFVKHQRGKRRFGVILIDLPDPTDETLARLYSKELYLMARQLLDPRGILAIQSADFFSFYHRTIFTTVAAAGFPSVLTYHPAHGGAYDAVVLASPRTDVARALKHLAVPVQTAVIRSGQDLDRVIVSGQPGAARLQAKVNRLLSPAILNDPAHFALWHYYLQPRLKRFLRDRLGIAALPATAGKRSAC